MGASAISIDEKKKALNGDEAECLEVPPEDSWFIETMDEDGNRLVYVIVRCTGLMPRRIGPFPDRRSAIAAFDCVVNELSEVLLGGDWLDVAKEKSVKRQFRRRDFFFFFYDEFVQQLYSGSRPGMQGGRKDKKWKA